MHLNALNATLNVIHNVTALKATGWCIEDVMAL